MQSHVKPVNSESIQLRPHSVSQAMSRDGGDFAEAFIENWQFAYFVCPSDAESNSWERENIISQDANDRLVTGARLVKIHPNRHLERSRKTAKHWSGQARNDGQTIPTTVCPCQNEEEGKAVFEAHTAEGTLFLVPTVNVPCDDVLCFMTVKCLSHRYFVVLATH